MGAAPVRKRKGIKGRKGGASTDTPKDPKPGTPEYHTRVQTLLIEAGAPMGAVMTAADQIQKSGADLERVRSVLAEKPKRLSKAKLCGYVIAKVRDE